MLGSFESRKEGLPERNYTKYVWYVDLDHDL